MLNDLVGLGAERSKDLVDLGAERSEVERTEWNDLDALSGALPESFLA